MDQKNVIYEQLLLISSSKNAVLLSSPNVINWLLGDLSFLPFTPVSKTQDNKVLKQLEDEWGRNTLKNRRPDLKLDKQWTNKFGEYICEELFTLLGHTVNVPVAMNNLKPDLETENTIIEVKTQTYFTSGTAGEKILGCPFKYVDIPSLYEKKLVIVCLGGAEKVSREQYGNLPGRKCTVKKQELLDLYKTLSIEFVGATDLVKQLLE
jgi:hypothetical protein